MPRELIVPGEIHDHLTGSPAYLPVLRAVVAETSEESGTLRFYSCAGVEYRVSSQTKGAGTTKESGGLGSPEVKGVGT